MTRNYLLGAAAAALSVAAFSGTAQAADVMPVIPVVTPVVVPVPGPVFEINIEQWFEEELLDGDFDPTSYTDVSLKLTTASGWGFEFLADVFTFILPPPEGHVDVTGRVFRSAGNIEIGAYAGFGFGWGGMAGFAYGFGGDFTYDTDRLTVESFVQANFAGGFQFLDTETDVTVHVTEKVDIYLGGGLETDFIGFDIDGYVGAQVDFGLLAPYATLWLDGGLGGELGVELEHQFGTGPFSLLGYAEVGFAGGLDFAAGIGIKYSRGGE